MSLSFCKLWKNSDFETNYCAKILKKLSQFSRSFFKCWKFWIFAVVSFYWKNRATLICSADVNLRRIKGRITIYLHQLHFSEQMFKTTDWKINLKCCIFGAKIWIFAPKANAFKNTKKLCAHSQKGTKTSFFPSSFSRWW